MTQKEWYEQNKTRISENKKKRYQENKESILAAMKLDYQSKRDKKLTAAKRYASKNKEKIRNYRKKYNKENAVQMASDRKAWRESNPTYNTKYQKERKLKDPEFHLLCNMRSRLSGALRNGEKFADTKSLVGCSFADLKFYLESKFKTGMNWENYGEWHVDHILPCCSFDLKDPYQQKQCFHFTNLQPLWALENLSKNGRIEQ